MKRGFDIVLSLVGLLLVSPLLVAVLIAIWAQDFHNPFYISQRVGKNNQPFYLYKLRSMRVGADKTGVDSTSSNDQRITKIGKFIRRLKLDEISQLLNVLLGNMSLVGPRPNVQREVDLYTSAEMKLLSIKPGITDFSSIVFSDEGDILSDKEDPDLSYNQLIRPGKGELGVFYVENNNLLVDIKLIYLTVVAIFSRKIALKGVSSLLNKLDASENLITLSLREKELTPQPPFGALEIVSSRDSAH